MSSVGDSFPVGAIVMREDAAHFHWQLFFHFRGNVVPHPLRHLPLWVQAAMTEAAQETHPDARLSVVYMDSPKMRLTASDIVYSIIPDTDHAGHYTVAVGYLGSRYTDGPLPMVVDAIDMVESMCNDICECLAKTYAKDHPDESADLPVFHVLQECECLQCRIVREND